MSDQSSTLTGIAQETSEMAASAAKRLFDCGGKRQCGGQFH